MRTGDSSKILPHKTTWLIQQGGKSSALTPLGSVDRTDWVHAASPGAQAVVRLAPLHTCRGRLERWARQGKQGQPG